VDYYFLMLNVMLIFFFHSQNTKSWP